MATQNKINTNTNTEQKQGEGPSMLARASAIATSEPVREAGKAAAMGAGFALGYLGVVALTKAFVAN
jgi:hypothetical protein